MKKNPFIIVCQLAVVLLISCSKYQNDESGKISAVNIDAQAILSNGSHMSFANGQASLLLRHLNGQVQHFSFHVIKDVNGNVKGSWESKSPGQELRTHGILNCLVFIDDRTAYMTGVVTQKVGYVFPGEYEVGMPVWFKVRDNGEGATATSDEFTDYYSLRGIECVDYQQASIHPVISGNIRVSR